MPTKSLSVFCPVALIRSNPSESTSQISRNPGKYSENSSWVTAQSHGRIRKHGQIEDISQIPKSQYPHEEGGKKWKKKLLVYICI